MPYHVQRTVELLDTDTVAVKKYIGRRGGRRGAADDHMTWGQRPFAGPAQGVYGLHPHVVDNPVGMPHAVFHRVAFQHAGNICGSGAHRHGGDGGPVRIPTLPELHAAGTALITELPFQVDPRLSTAARQTGQSALVGIHGRDCGRGRAAQRPGARQGDGRRVVRDGSTVVFIKFVDIINEAHRGREIVARPDARNQAHTPHIPGRAHHDNVIAPDQQDGIAVIIHPARQGGRQGLFQHQGTAVFTGPRHGPLAAVDQAHHRSVALTGRKLQFRIPGQGRHVAVVVQGPAFHGARADAVQHFRPHHAHFLPLAQAQIFQGHGRAVLLDQKQGLIEVPLPLDGRLRRIGGAEQFNFFEQRGILGVVARRVDSQLILLVALFLVDKADAQAVDRIFVTAGGAKIPRIAHRHMPGGLPRLLALPNHAPLAVNEAGRAASGRRDIGQGVPNLGLRVVYGIEVIAVLGAPFAPGLDAFKMDFSIGPGPEVGPPPQHIQIGSRRTARGPFNPGLAFLVPVRQFRRGDQGEQRQGILNLVGSLDAHAHHSQGNVPHIRLLGGVSRADGADIYRIYGTAAVRVPPCRPPLDIVARIAERHAQTYALAHGLVRSRAVAGKRDLAVDRGNAPFAERK